MCRIRTGSPLAGSCCKEIADFQKDYLLPRLVANCRLCFLEGTPVGNRHATQTRLFCGLRVAGEQLFRHKAASFWTPYSGRHFLPSAAVVLCVSMTDRDMLGGWAPQRRDRYSRVSRSRNGPDAKHRLPELCGQGESGPTSRVVEDSGRFQLVFWDSNELLQRRNIQVREALESHAFCGHPA